MNLEGACAQDIHPHPAYSQLCGPLVSRNGCSKALPLFPALHGQLSLAPGLARPHPLSSALHGQLSLVPRAVRLHPFSPTAGVAGPHTLCSKAPPPFLCPARATEAHTLPGSFPSKPSHNATHSVSSPPKFCMLTPLAPHGPIQERINLIFPGNICGNRYHDILLCFNEFPKLVMHYINKCFIYVFSLLPVSLHDPELVF